MSFKSKWIDYQLSVICKINPTINKREVEAFLSKTYDDKLNDRKIVLHNDYQDDTVVNTNITKLYDWVKVKKPIIAGSGTFFHNQNENKSPISDIINSKKADRKRYQRIRDQYPKDSYEYRYNEMMQMEAKVKLNSIYGSFGAPTFRLYNKYVAQAITGTAQSLISATAMGFESLLTNNVPFRNLDECIKFIMNISSIQDDTEPSMSIDLKITTIKDIKTVFDKLKSTFREYKSSYDDTILSLLKKCDVNTLTHIYYNNNIYEFMKNDSIRSLIISIFDDTTEFKNPNDVPDNIKDRMDLLWEYIDEYVYYNFNYTEPINRLKNDKRKTAVLIDTDSNLVNGHPWVLWMKDNIWEQTSSSMDDDNKKFASINILAYVITMMLKKLLRRHCECCNILEEYIPVINMKNEFYFEILLLATVKKRYIAKMVLREGKLMNPYIKEIKGHDFKKAMISDNTQSRLIGIIEKRIFEVDEIDTAGILSDLAEFERDIKTSLLNGERTYTILMNCKHPSAYANPYSQGAVTSVLVWNTLFPDREIQLPDKVDCLNLHIPNVKVLDKIKNSYPKEYSIMKEYILEGDIESFRKNGIKYIALPNDYEGIPEFIKPFIDYDAIVSRNIGTFLPIQEALGLSTLLGSNDKSYFSNVIDI